MNDLFIVAQILRPHGRRGEVVLRTLTDHIETLMSAPRVYLGQDASEPVRVEGIRLHKNSPLLKLEGVDDMDSAIALKGAQICLPLEDLAPLEEGEYFLHDLVGLKVLDHKGEIVGLVGDFVQTGGPPLLTGVRKNGEGFMIPFSPGTVDEVDLEKRTIKLVDLPGLLEN